MILSLLLRLIKTQTNWKSILNNINSTMERAIFAFLRVLMLPEMKLREISELEEKIKLIISFLRDQTLSAL